MIVRSEQRRGIGFPRRRGHGFPRIVWLAWQAWRKDNYEIMTRPWQTATPGGNHGRSREPGQRLEPGDRDRFPRWRFRRLGYLRPGELRRAGSAQVGNGGRQRSRSRPPLVSRRGAAWLATERPALDRLRRRGRTVGQGLRQRQPRASCRCKNGGYPLYEHRTVRVKCLVGGKLMQPAGSLEGAWGHLRLGKELAADRRRRRGRDLAPGAPPSSARRCGRSLAQFCPAL